MSSCKGWSQRPECLLNSCCYFCCSLVAFCLFRWLVFVLFVCWCFVFIIVVVSVVWVLFVVVVVGWLVGWLVCWLVCWLFSINVCVVWSQRAECMCSYFWRSCQRAEFLLTDGVEDKRHDSFGPSTGWFLADHSLHSSCKRLLSAALLCVIVLENSVWGVIFLKEKTDPGQNVSVIIIIVIVTECVVCVPRPWPFNSFFSFFLFLFSCPPFSLFFCFFVFLFFVCLLLIGWEFYGPNYLKC